MIATLLEDLTVGLLAGQLTVLAAAAIFAWRQVGEARRLGEQQARPFVIVDFDVEDFLFFIEVTNLGATLARDVRVSIDPPLGSAINTTDERMTQLKIFTEGIPTLAPGKKIRTLFDSAIERKPDEGKYPISTPLVCPTQTPIAAGGSRRP
jgi:hypothetical protein